MFSARSIIQAILIFSLGWALNGCDDSSTPPSQPIQAQPDTPKPIDDLTKEAWSFYHIHGVDSLSHPVACFSEFKQTIIKLIQEPSEPHLDESRKFLDQCRSTYNSTWLFIAANQQTQIQLDAIHQRIKQPLEMPGFVDSVKDYPYSGIVNDTSMPLTKDELLRQHGLTDPSDVSLGFAVIKFLLWGESIYQEKLPPRLAEDFVPVTQWSKRDHEIGLNELDIKEHANNRRRRYLEMATLILETDLNLLATTWNKNTLPPLNQKAGTELQGAILNQWQSLISDNANAKLREALLALLVEPSKETNHLTATPLSNWLNLASKPMFENLLNAEAPLESRQEALKQLLAP